ncbi:NAD(P)-dependent dehydrogenase (short-subunit alcohol dehydrogenase family) [Hamadaea flava]|uniref:SDR family NAD(P)-dependent oxidoreductase n=1 Tax=Hamadaea flava TaxID=1742688 RepID=A0ABV8LKY3_9ACTN|nr:SDR family NAD(P)-dependent oxidoreductase [Hamadaea flava]MCP2324097.1 NAD(P)-dependent dehydrogenase (short-subunit alcohol dehydrogenase family) [Hamadaea flava]
MTALVTGGTGGIGFHIAAKLRAAGQTVLITGRDADRGQAAADRLGATFLPADHAMPAGRHRLAQLVRDQAAQLSVLVNNVGGAAYATRTVTAEGHEAILALNYLGPVALTQSLLPLLTPDAAVVQVVSSAFTMHTADPFTEPAAYTAIGAYARAKQLSVLATLHLARLLPQAKVNAVNPGMAWTAGVAALTPEAVPAWRYVWPIVRFFQRRAAPEKAARGPAALAIAPDLSGRYYEGGRPRPLPSRLLDPQWQRRAWDEVAAAVG